ncbi:MAG: hypothetical protein JNL40_13285 [Cyclobacteriaceae bacterium]|nr:hypothetical protein [Cyclobacteriaceae bacterium]
MKSHVRLLLIILLTLPLTVLAQKGGSGQAQKGGQGQKDSERGNSQGNSGNCFKEWYDLFRDRGASTVTDGTHEVILTLRNTRDGSSKCYMGRAEVVGGKFKRPVMIQKMDGSYEPFTTIGKGLDPAFAKSLTEDEFGTITDGMSINFLMSDQEYGRIFFYTFLNEKPKSLKQAPSPKSLVKN